MRLIDADALLEILREDATEKLRLFDLKYEGYLTAMAKVEEIVEDILPTIDPVKWIPVTERLPEKSGHYLITVVSDVTDGEPTVFTDDYFVYGWDDWGDDVVAWAIKPEPWKGEEE